MKKRNICCDLWMMRAELDITCPILMKKRKFVVIVSILHL